MSDSEDDSSGFGDDGDEEEMDWADDLPIPPIAHWADVADREQFRTMLRARDFTFCDEAPPQPPPPRARERPPPGCQNLAQSAVDVSSEDHVDQCAGALRLRRRHSRQRCTFW